MMLEAVFWVCVGILGYALAGDYLLLQTLAAVRRREPGARSYGGPLPTVSVIVTAYNEEAVIARRIENLRALDYPPKLLEIVVASDGSTDATVAEARRFAGHGVSVLDLPRRGKALAQNAAVEASRGEVLVLTDADAEFEKGFVREAVCLLRSDPRVGCVAGHAKWRRQPGAVAELKESYWAAENHLRRLESKLGLLASGTGPGMAVWRRYWRPMRSAIDDPDAVTPLDVILENGKVLFGENAVVYDEPFLRPGSEFRAKVRAVHKGTRMILGRWRGLSWLRHPLISWRLVSHYFVRWVAPYIVLLLFVVSALLSSRHAVYRLAFALELALVGIGLVGYVADRRARRVPLASLVYGLMVVNAGFAVGLAKAITGRGEGMYETE